MVNDDGVDLTMVRSELARTPAERLDELERFVNFFANAAATRQIYPRRSGAETRRIRAVLSMSPSERLEELAQANLSKDAEHTRSRGEPRS
jgi:hypothetical protein